MPLYKVLFTIAHLRLLLVVFLLAFMTPGCRKVSQSEDSVQRTGRYLAQKFGYIDDPEVTALLDRVGSRIMRASEPLPSPPVVLLLDTPEKGAFSTAGGRIYLTRGLLLELQNEAELAAVVAHEVSHHLSGDTEREARSEEESLERELRADQVGVKLLHRARYPRAAAFTALRAFSDREPQVVARMRVLATTLLERDPLSTENSREFNRVKRLLRGE